MLFKILPTELSFVMVLTGLSFLLLLSLHVLSSKSSRSSRASRGGCGRVGRSFARASVGWACGVNVTDVLKRMGDGDLCRCFSLASSMILKSITPNEDVDLARLCFF